MTRAFHLKNSFLCAHQCKVLRVLGEDDFTHLFSGLRPEQFNEVTVPEWTSLAGSNESERTERLKLARQCPELVQATESSPFWLTETWAVKRNSI